ncbi:MAG: hypothetical protein GXP16_02990, partial [Gammaproteobacteria bacterium]|nr:hypothetical protein [Gammaproteobacteria bacterium]
MSNNTIPPNSFSCCLIGGDTLLTQCGEQLLTAGHKIVKVVTDSNSVTGWAIGHSIPVLAVSSDYATVLQTCDYDYLFAITHLALISDAVVESPKKGAINFHDGPLPSYAGLNTPMWAIINGESTYGISWHVMATGIDTGDLLLTQSIRIAEDDTAVSLNTKCFAAALDSFPTLINQVAENSLSPIAQDLAQRNYYARADRPQNFCVLDWQLPATTLGRLVKALHTDRYENVLGTAKLITNDTVYTVEDCAAYDEMPTTSAGEILAITERGVQVSCGEGVLEIRRLQNLSGVTVAIESLNLAVGDNLTYNLGGAVESVANRIAKDEFYWIKVLSQTHALSLPYRETSSKVSNSDVVKQRQVSIPDNLQKADAKALAGAFVTFLARVTGSDTVSLAISGNSLSECAIEHPLLLCDYALVNIEVDQAIPVNEEIKNIQTDMFAALSKSPWLRDLVTRQPKLRANPIFANETPQPVAINFDSIGQGLSAELTLCLASPNEPQIRYMSGAYSEKSIDQLLQHFETWLHSIATQPEARYCDL